MDGSPQEAGSRPVEQRPRRRPSVRYRLLDGVGYLVHRHTCLALDPVAWRIWLMCDGLTGMPEMLAGLAREFDVPGPDEVERDIRKFLADLERQGFLSRV